MASQGVKLGLGVVGVFAVFVGGYLAYVHHRNAVDNAAPPEVVVKSDPDDLVFLKNEHPMSLKDEKDLKGRTLWMSAGGQMRYFPFSGRVDYAHTQGVLLGAEKITVKDAVEQAAPKTQDATFYIPAGDKQVLLVFTKDGDSKEYAVPVGYEEKGTYTLSTDQMFFYDDPHKLYSYWAPEIWQAIDAHKVIVGMNEKQAMMAWGQVLEYQGDKPGNRVVIFHLPDGQKRVTFEHGKATKIEDVPA
jgi:hypothetical protein